MAMTHDYDTQGDHSHRLTVTDFGSLVVRGSGIYLGFKHLTLSMG